MQAKFAPIAVFAYDRPEHLRKCLTSLAANAHARDSHVTIYCDGPKPGRNPDAVESVRQVAREWSVQIPGAFAQITVVEQASNRGLAGSVIAGVTQMLERNDRVIVVEDDLVVSPDFLAFMNQGLDLYEKDSEVISIHGFMYSVDSDLGQSVFLRGADCWGWATWRRGWALFRSDSTELLHELRQRSDRSDFDFQGAFPYTNMLTEQAAGKIDSWAVRWYASAFLADKVTLYPGKSLVKNIGQDSSGTNYLSFGQARSSHQPEMARMVEQLRRIPIRESSEARDAVTRSLLKGGQTSIVGKVKKYAVKIIGKNEN